MSVADDVVAAIGRAELVEFALEISNIDSSVPNEAEVADLYQWLRRQGLVTRKVGLLSDRFNVNFPASTQVMPKPVPSAIKA